MTDIRANTVITHRDGIAQVQHFGEAHVVEGSETIIDVPVGVTVVIRHVELRQKEPAR